MRQELQEEYAWGHVVGHEGAAARCTECGRCEEHCTQHLDIVNRLKQIAAWERGTAGET
jgi:predicted aldo/keto reductase-like oxidoreductase